MRSLPVFTFALLVACSSSSGDVERPYVTCAGACDAPGSLPELGAIDLSETLSCTSVIDVSALDDSSANDRLECSLSRAPVQGASLSVSVTVKNGEVLREGSARAGESLRVGSLPRAGYPYDVEASIRFGLPGGSVATYKATVVIFDYNTFRDLEVEPMVIGLPVQLWPVRIWPDTSIQSAWTGATLRVLSLTNAVTVPFGDAELRHSFRFATQPREVELVTFPDAFFFHVPAPLEGASGATATVETYRRGGAQDEVDSTISGPGYYVLDESGTLTLTPIAELPILPGYAGYGSAVPNEPDPDPEPVVIPDDPCGAGCRSDEVCVGGSCLERRLQTQDAGSCGSPSPSACDPGEHGDCAELHVCIEAECRNLVCQRQVFPDCPTPSASCTADDDCYPGHTCADGACRNDNCESR